MPRNPLSYFKTPDPSIWAIVICLLCGLTIGCTQKEITCPGNETRIINIKFMWDSIPENSPEGMTVYFFPAGAHEKIWMFNLPSYKGGKVEIPTGTYRIIAYNNDTHHIDFCNRQSYFTFEAATVPSDGIRLSNGEPLHFPPENLYSASIEWIRVTECGVEYLLPDQSVKNCGEYLVRMWPKECIWKYSVILKDTEGLDNVTKIEGRVSGLYGDCHLYDQTGKKPEVTMPFSMHKQGVKQPRHAEGSFLNFGESQDASQILSLKFSLNNGTEYIFSGDISSQIKNSKATRHVIIIIRGIKIPSDGDKPIDGDSGLNVGVDGWTQVDINLWADIK